MTTKLTFTEKELRAAIREMERRGKEQTDECRGTHGYESAQRWRWGISHGACMVRDLILVKRTLAKGECVELDEHNRWIADVLGL